MCDRKNRLTIGDKMPADFDVFMDCPDGEGICDDESVEHWEGHRKAQAAKSSTFCYSAQVVDHGPEGMSIQMRFQDVEVHAQLTQGTRLV